MAERKVSIVIAAQDMASNVLGQVQARLSSMTANIVSGLAIYNAAEMAIRGVSRALVEGVRAAAEAERVDVQLQRAMKSVGVARRSATDELSEYAGAMAKTTNFEDDAIKSAMQLLITIGHLEGDGLQAATSAAIDLSTALGKDLNDSAMALAKYATGSATALSKMGIETKDAKGELLSMDKIIEQITARMGGAAESDKNTLYGSIEAVKKAFGELQESFGKWAEGGMLGSAVSGWTMAFEKMGAALDERTAARTDVNAALRLVQEPNQPAPGFLGELPENLRRWDAARGQLEALIRQIYELGDAAGMTNAQMYEAVSTIVDPQNFEQTLWLLKVSRTAAADARDHAEAEAKRQKALIDTGNAAADAGDKIEKMLTGFYGPNARMSLGKYETGTLRQSRSDATSAAFLQGLAEATAPLQDWLIDGTKEVDPYSRRLEHWNEMWKEQERIIDGIVNTVRSGIAGGIYEALNNTRSLGEEVKAIYESVLDTIKRMIAELLASELIKLMFGSFAGGSGMGWFGSIFSWISGGGGGGLPGTGSSGPLESYSAGVSFPGAPSLPGAGGAVFAANFNVLAPRETAAELMKEIDYSVRRRGMRMAASWSRQSGGGANPRSFPGGY